MIAYPAEFIDRLKTELPHDRDMHWSAEHGEFALGDLLCRCIIGCNCPPERRKIIRKFIAEWTGLPCVMDEMCHNLLGY